tara:strand:- start:5186 stop:6043 length:858 start_codon:yes stop_codon:yes gene_type:complete
LSLRHSDLKLELVPITTSGDKISDRPLTTIGGKGLFIKELEQALYEGRADLAVHSMKDVPVEIPKDFNIGAILKRADPRDAVVTNTGVPFSELNLTATIGTSSLRRKSQLLAMQKHLVISDLRGNVTTRLRKLRDGEFDAIILAAAGLQRLGFSDLISTLFDPEQIIPAIGQGAIGIECRVDDFRTQALIQPLHDRTSGFCVAAERAMSAILEGGCDIPVAGYAIVTQAGEMRLTGMIASLDGSRVVRDEITGAPENGNELGRQLGENLLAAGAAAILSDLRSGP